MADDLALTHPLAPLGGVTPPLLRFDSPQALFAAIPYIRRLTTLRPRAGEENAGFLTRLRTSPTPEEAVTFAAFALSPAAAVCWGYECLRLMAEHLDPSERPMMERIAGWIAHPADRRRQDLLARALSSATAGPSVQLGLAAGWSGGALAQDDPREPEIWRCPEAVNNAVLGCLARAGVSRRSCYLSWFADMSDSLIQV